MPLSTATGPRRRSASRFVRTILVAAPVGLGLGLIPPIGSPAAQSAPSLEVNDFERQVVDIVNAERSARGLAPVQPDRRLWDAAEAHAEWMAANRRLSHTGAGGSTLATRAWAEGYRYTALGEVLARGQRSPEEVVRGRPCDRWCGTVCDGSARCDGWKQSPGHWNIIVSPSYRDLGVAYVAGPADMPHWWGILFGNSRDANQPLDLGGGLPATPTATKTATTPPTATRLPSRTPWPSATPTATVLPTTGPEVTRTAFPTASPRPPTITPVSATATPAPAQSDARLLGQVELQGRADVSGVLVLVNGSLASVTGVDGGFLLPKVASGIVVVEVVRPGWLSSRAILVLASGERRDLGATRLLAGDLDANRRIEYSDYRGLIASYGQCRGSTRFNPNADFDDDGCVAFSDFGLLFGNYGRSGPSAWGQY
ncbi:MAG: hypothetical protein H6648_00410 [Caldilineae bacterium]|nr:hypothetical protein [Caldilineae bacterium]